MRNLLFNSYEFIFLFLPISFFIYFYLNSRRLTEASKGFLVFSSLFFYSWWNVVYLPLILGSMLFNYVVGNALTRDGTKNRIDRKAVLFFGVAANVGLLGYFKYADFFIANLNGFTGTDIPLLHLALPLAISFFTFQQIAYLVDSFRRETHEYDFLNYAVFVTFFPQLIAGPIVHHKEMMPQFANVYNKLPRHRNIAKGLFIFSIGLFKKVVIADTLALWANMGFDTAATLNFLEAWMTSLSYTFQLYFDFSGYTDMAIGAALIFNIKLPINFNSPYKSRNIQEFWRRWHITLSRFLKEYVYIPMGGNRKGDGRTYGNLMATFVIGGLWHGAGWTFVFWGFMHGVALIVYRVWSKTGIKIPSIVSWVVTFNFINMTWVFFRAKEWEDALRVLSGMVDVTQIVLPQQLYGKLSILGQYGVEFGEFLHHIGGGGSTLLWVTFAFVLTVFFKNSGERLHEFKMNYVTAVVAAGCFSYAVISLNQFSEFLYFNF